MNPTRILLLGGNGLLGTALRQILGAEGMDVHVPTSSEVDIRDLESIQIALAKSSADLLINSAAQSNTGRAEEEPELAFAVNADGARNVALASKKAGIPLVHVSSDYVFDGKAKRPYKETDPTGVPPSVYGQSKLKGELLVRKTWPQHFILRVASLFGEGGRPDFVDWVLEKADPQKPLTIVADRIVSPTWTFDFARQVRVLVRTRFFGTYHATGQGGCSWYDLACSALKLSGRDPSGVCPVPDSELKSNVVRPVFSALDNDALRALGLDCMRPWEEALAMHLHGRK
ncbi:MAG: dTDP-4-dehydrorhamnose reductase [Pseudomonadota bacterium]